MCEYMNGSRTARRSRTGVRYFDEFRTHFWEKPEDAFDRIRNMSISNRRRGRGILSPAPSIEVVEQVLSRRTSRRRSRSRSNQRGRTRSESPSRNEDDSNIGNPAEGGGNTTTSSVQPPSYEASTSNQQSSNSADDGVTGNNVGQ